MTAERNHDDGNLPAARKELDLAIHGLIDPQPHTTPDNTIHWCDSWYIQLQDSVAGQKQHGHGISRSEPPLWTDPVDLITAIDRRVCGWEPHWPLPLPSLLDVAYNPDDEPATVLRLRLINRRRWRPQDVRLVSDIAAQIHGWVVRIRELINPTPRWSLPNPCPACDTAIVYRRDPSGDKPVRQPALQIGPHGCTCAHCGHTWAPDYFPHLARTLGYELPEGVLE